MINCVGRLLWFILFCVSRLFNLYIDYCLQNMSIALLGWVLCNPVNYDPPQESISQDSAAQTADMELQSAGPRFF